jgi:cysteine synthase A
MALAAAAAADLQSAVARLLQAGGKEAAAQALRDELGRLGSDADADGDALAIGATTACSTDETVPTTQAALRDVTDVIGHTPLVQLDLARLGFPDSADGVRVLAKLEFQNPGGSVKDRIALQMIEAAEREGTIQPGVTTLVEATSGNTGIALAMVAAARGYRLIVTMSRLHAMTERYILIRAFGAEVALAEPELKAQGFIDLAEKIARETPNAVLLSQFTNQHNPRAHYDTTGPEIYEQTSGAVDILVAGAGTGGTVVGTGRYLKERNPAVHVVCVEPASSRVFQGAKHRAHSLVGIGTGLHVPMLEDLAPGQPHVEGEGRGLVDSFMGAQDGASLDMALRMAREQGLLVGPTSGAATICACELACRSENAGKTIVVMCASSAVRYIQHPMFKSLRDEASRVLSGVSEPPSRTAPIVAPAPLLLTQDKAPSNQSAVVAAAPESEAVKVERATRAVLELVQRLINVPELKPLDTLVDFGATSLTAMLILGQVRTVLEPIVGDKLRGMKLAMIKEALWGNVQELTLGLLGLDGACLPLPSSTTLQRDIVITFCGG